MNTDPAGPRLRFDHVTKWYGPVAALLDVSFQVGVEVVGLVGKNGVGKSSLMKLAAGLLRPSQGRVEVLGAAADSRAARRVLGFCPDLDRLPDGLPARRFVAWQLQFHGLSAGAAHARAGEVLEQLGLGEAMARRIGTFSKGMRQRVRLAQALAHGPRLLLLDEPMTGLDPVARNELAAIVAALPETGVGVLISSHVLHELETLVDRVVLVHQGRLLAEGRVDDLRAALPGRPRTFRIAARDLRELAAQVVRWPAVTGVTVVDGAVHATVLDPSAFHRALTRLGATSPDGLTEVVALDDDLATVFAHLVG